MVIFRVYNETGYIEYLREEEAVQYSIANGNLAIETVIVSESEISEVSENLIPNWDAFLDAIAGIDDASFLNNLRASNRWDFILARLGNIADNPESFKGSSDRLLTYWNTSKPNLTEAQREALIYLAEQNNLPLRLTEDNTLEVL